MYIQDISNPKEKHKEVQRSYPLFKTVRIKATNLDRIKQRATRYSQTIDDLVEDLLMKVDYYERIGYEMPAENKSW